MSPKYFLAQQTNTCSQSRKETLEEDVKYVQKLRRKTPQRPH